MKKKKRKSCKRNIVPKASLKEQLAILTGKESGQVTTTKMASQKVTNTVGTFLNHNISQPK